MNALQQLNLAAPITDTYTAIEQAIICRIAAQIAGNPQGLINNSSEWRIQMLARMGRLTKDTAKIIAAGSKGVGNEIEAAINTSVQSVLKTHDLTMTDKLSENIRSALTMYDRQAISGKYNQVNTVMQYKAKQTYLKAVDGTVSRFDRIMQKELDSKLEYLNVLNKNAMAVTLGERSRTEAIRETIEEMSDKGIPAFIDASGREWSAEAYVNMDIRNTVKNSANAAQFACIEELGQDVVLVSSHAGARPLCAPYQGKFYSLSGKSGTIRDARGKEYTYEPWSSTSYGEAAGLLGINCGHSIRGVSDGMFINREKQYDEKENSEEYDKVVKQRELERKIRKQKTTRNALQAAGDDEGAREYDRKIKETTAQLNAYCEKNGLAVRVNRTEVYGYSDLSRKNQHTDFVLTTDKNGDIINLYKGKGISVFPEAEIPQEVVSRVENATKKITSDFKILEKMSEGITFGALENNDFGTNTYFPSTGKDAITLLKNGFSNHDTLLQCLKDDYKSGKSYDTDYIESLVAHEMGHNAHVALALKRAGLEYGKPLNPIGQKLFDDEFQRIRREVYEAAFTDEDFDEIQNACVDQLGLMTYCDPDELIAQSFGNYYYGNNKSAIGKSIVEFFKKGLK